MSLEPAPVCVDASFVVRLILPADDRNPAHSLWRKWREESLVPVAPGLLYYEVTNALYRYERLGELLAEEVDEALAIAMRLNIRRVEDDDLHRQALSLARSHDLSAAYDSHYLALGRRLGCDVWTFDRKLAQATGEALPLLRLVQ